MSRARDIADSAVVINYLDSATSNIQTQINNRIQVANVAATYATKAYAAANSYVKTTLANTNSYIATKASSNNATITAPTITGYTESVVAIGTVSSSHTIAITSGTLLTATLTASTACTFTMPTATAGKSFTLLLKQAASTGNGTATFTNVKWGTAGAPTITATAGKMDILTFVSDGTNWYGTYIQGYTP